MRRPRAGNIRSVADFKIEQWSRSIRNAREAQGRDWTAVAYHVAKTDERDNIGRLPEVYPMTDVDAPITADVPVTPGRKLAVACVAGVIGERFRFVSMVSGRDPKLAPTPSTRPRRA